MAKSAKMRKPMSARSKGAICLAILLALTVFVSFISISGLSWGDNGMNVLLPWVPVTSAGWPESLPLNRAMGGGVYYEYAAALPEGGEGDLNAETEAAAQVIRQRLNRMSENDVDVTAKDGAVRLELRSMDADRLNSVLNMAIMGGKFEFKSGENVILTEKDIASARLAVNASNTGYNLEIKTTQAGKEALAASGASSAYIYCDGENTNYIASMKEDTLTAYIGSTQNAYNSGANLAFLLNTGAVNVKLTQSGSGEVAATSASVKTVFIIAAAAILVCALAYLAFTGKLTGVAGFLTAWCAVILTMFFVATIVVPSASVVALTVGCLVAVLMGVLLAVYTAVVRTDAIAAQIADGSAPRQAAKFGFRSAAKNVWIAHGAVLAVAVILMIIPATRAIGYSLAAGVAGSAITACLMRAYLACFMTMNGKAALYGKVK